MRTERTSLALAMLLTLGVADTAHAQALHAIRGLDEEPHHELAYYRSVASDEAGHIAIVGGNIVDVLTERGWERETLSLPNLILDDVVFDGTRVVAVGSAETLVTRAVSAGDEWTTVHHTRRAPGYASYRDLLVWEPGRVLLQARGPLAELRRGRLVVHETETLSDRVDPRLIEESGCEQDASMAMPVRGNPGHLLVQCTDRSARIIGRVGDIVVVPRLPRDVAEFSAPPSGFPQVIPRGDHVEVRMREGAGWTPVSVSGEVMSVWATEHGVFILTRTELFRL